MRVNRRIFPVIIVAVFILGMIFAFLLGFRPQHGGEGGQREQGASSSPVVLAARAEMGML